MVIKNRQILKQLVTSTIVSVGYVVSFTDIYNNVRLEIMDGLKAQVISTKNCVNKREQIQQNLQYNDHVKLSKSYSKGYTLKLLWTLWFFYIWIQ